MVTRAPKNKAVKKAKPAAKNTSKNSSKKSVKSSAKKAPVKQSKSSSTSKAVKAPKKAEVKVALKKELTASDVKQILDARELVERQKHVLAELESRGVKSIHRIPKKADKEIGRAHV